VLANTPATAKKHETLKILPGILDRVTVNFPAGCHGMVYVQILYASSPLVPSERDQALVGDDQEIPTSCATEVKQGYETIDIYAWSPGTEYSHSISITVNVFTVAEKSRLEDYSSKLLSDFEKFMKYLGMKEA
jgi:hypothetical protein